MSTEKFHPQHDLTREPTVAHDSFTDIEIVDPFQTTWFSNEKLASKAPYNGIAMTASLTTTGQAYGIRKTGIICTIGPNTNSVDALVALRKAGMNILRMNFSHGSYEYHGSVIANLRKSYDVFPGPQVAIALDTKGPEIRTGTMANGEVKLLVGASVTLHTDREWATKCDVDHVFVDYPAITRIVPVGGPIFIDDGLIKLVVTEVRDTELVCVVQSNGALSNNKGVNLPGSPVDLPSISTKDAADLRWGVAQGVDIIFASFIRSGEAIRQIREVLGPEGHRIQIIAKIENQQGLDNFDDILTQTDGIMVARGDLGIEIPVEKVFLAQKMMIAKCNIVGKSVICATQMLESMTTNPRPTRAEVSDVANAVLDGSDLVMLSGETAKGTYPNEAVTTMAQICVEAESAFNHNQYFKQISELQAPNAPTADTLAAAAVNAAFSRDLQAIVVFSISGRTARLVSRYRPHCPIICVTTDEVTARQSHLSRGIFPILVNPDYKADSETWLDFTERKLLEAIAQAKLPIGCASEGLVKAGDRVVILQGWTGGKGQSNTLRLVSL